jgi:cytochrome c5
MQNRIWIKCVLILTLILFNETSMSYAGKLISASNNQPMNGPKLWANNCARCHNNRSPTEFTPNQWGTIMMHMRLQGGLTGEESKAILDYLTQASLSEFTTATTPSSNQQVSASTQPNTKSNEQTASNKKTSEVTSSGSAVYQKSCVACHGGDGKGIAPSIPDFTKKGGVLSKSSGVLLNNIIQGIGAMPAKGGNSSLSDEDMKAVLNYIQNTFSK